MSTVHRLPAKEAYARLQAGKALLVCAYTSDEKFAANHLEGAISYSDFVARDGKLDKSQELIFYCG